MKYADRLLLFPLTAIALSVIGFTVGIPITRLHFLLSVLIAGGICCLTVPKESRRTTIVLFLLLLASSIFVSAIPVMYTITDGANCHRPAVFLLANGWNPIWQPEANQITDLLKSHFDIVLFHLRPEHITYTPRGAWIYGAVLYKIVGFVEVMDSLNIYMLIAALLIANEWLKAFPSLCKSVRLLFALVICLSPHVVSSIFGGAIDAPVYLMTIVGLLKFDSYRRWRKNVDLVMGVIALALSCSIKFSGLAMSIVIPLAYLAFTRGRRALAIAAPVTIVLVFALNASPLITSWVNHGGPFYPSHSFDKNEKVKDNVTFDFDVKNEDAQKMGYAGRLCFAYVSSCLTKEYYKRKLNQQTFNPQLLTFEPIDGFGPMFQVLLMASIVGLFFVKDRGIKLMAGILLTSIFLLPAKYMGYSRYVAQIYAIPLLVAVTLVQRLKNVRGQLMLAFVLGGVSVVQMKKDLMPYPYMWLQSVQNLQTVLAVEKDSAPTVASEYYYAAFALTQDTSPKVEMISLEQAATNTFKHSYGPLNQRFMYLTNDEMPDFRGFACTSVKGDDAIINKSFHAQRMQGIEKYFIREFVPKELLLMPKRFCQTMAYRGRQVARAWPR